MRIGLEEEVFVVNADGVPCADGLYALARLVAKNPRRFYTRTAANTPRGADLRYTRFGSIEIATGVHATPDELIEELICLRRELSSACPSRIIAAGCLPLFPDTLTVVAALQLHFSGFSDRIRAVRAFLYFAPALLLLTANSPAIGEVYETHSLRILKNPFIGVPTNDPYERFSDVIISRRLGTVEIRLFDPCPQIDRVRALVKAAFSIASALDEIDVEIEREEYARLRQASVREGCKHPDIRKRCLELSELSKLPFELFEQPPAITAWRLFRERGAEAYEELDALYRSGVDFSGVALPRVVRAAIGIGGWYVPRLPYNAYKLLREHGYL